MITVTFYYRENDPNNTFVHTGLEAYKKNPNIQILPVCVDTVTSLQEIYSNTFPVLRVGPYTLRYPFTEKEITVMVNAALHRANQMDDVGDPTYSDRIRNTRRINFLDRIYLWLSRHYMAAFNGLVALFLLLAFMAPVFMKIGAVLPAKVIYTVYSPLCHQFAFRSFFLFGAQADYPRALANTGSLITYDQISGTSSVDLLEARAYTGDEFFGYKLALCERDIAIYGSILIFGLIFSLFRDRIRHIPFWVFLVIGILPIGLDGFSQIPSLATGFPGYFPIRESSPFLRILTGSAFGFTLAWLFYPIIGESLGETKKILDAKQAIINAVQKENSK